MANANVIKGAWLKNKGGAITDQAPKYKGDGSSTYPLGSLAYVSGGTLVPVGSGATALTTGAAPFNGVYKYVKILKAVAAATTDFIPEVQEIDASTLFEGYVVNLAADDVSMDQTDIGKTYQGYQTATGQLAVNNLVTNGIFTIDSVDVVDEWIDDNLEKDSGGVRHQRVTFRLKTGLVTE